MINAYKGDQEVLVTRGFYEGSLKPKGWLGESTHEEADPKADLMAMEYQALKDMADEAGLDYPGNISKEKLVDMILEDQAEDEKG